MTAAVAVELACVPASGVLLTVVFVPNWGFTDTATVVPKGMLAALSDTVTGLVLVGGRERSGVTNEPLGVAGTGTPPTEVIARVGNPGTNTGPGRPRDRKLANGVVTF